MGDPLPSRPTSSEPTTKRETIANAITVMMISRSARKVVSFVSLVSMELRFVPIRIPELMCSARSNAYPLPDKKGGDKDILTTHASMKASALGAMGVTTNT